MRRATMNNKETLEEYFSYFDDCRKDPFCESGATMALNKLDPDERNIFIIYLYQGSVKKTAEYFNCTASFMGKRIKEIKQKIKELI